MTNRLNSVPLSWARKSNEFLWTCSIIKKKKKENPNYDQIYKGLFSRRLQLGEAFKKLQQL